MKKPCLGKILQAPWERFLYEKNNNYNSYKFSFKLRLYFFGSFAETKNKN